VKGFWFPYGAAHFFGVGCGSLGGFLAGCLLCLRQGPCFSRCRRWWASFHSPADSGGRPPPFHPSVRMACCLTFFFHSIMHPLCCYHCGHLCHVGQFCRATAKVPGVDLTLWLVFHETPLTTVIPQPMGLPPVGWLGQSPGLQVVWRADSGDMAQCGFIGKFPLSLRQSFKAAALLLLGLHLLWTLGQPFCLMCP
jgi:hypothetical protein